MIGLGTLGAIGSTLAPEVVAGGLGLFGGGIQQAHAKDLQEDQQDFVKWQMQNRFQLMRGDLEAAGYNPILAVNQNPGLTSGGIGPGIANPLDAAAASAKTIPGRWSKIKALQNEAKRSEESVKTQKALTDQAKNTAWNQMGQYYRNIAESYKFDHESNILSADHLKHRAMGEFWRKHGDWLPWADVVQRGASTVRDLAGAFIPWAIGKGKGGPGTFPGAPPGPWRYDPRVPRVPYRRPAGRYGPNWR